jgi:U3 small nucleolar RNA-associated protein 3
MGKKRKAGGKPFGEAGAKESNVSTSKLTLNSYEDVADSEDEFFINRDKILLDEAPAAKKQRRQAEDGRKARKVPDTC